MWTYSRFIIIIRFWLSLRKITFPQLCPSYFLTLKKFPHSLTVLDPTIYDCKTYFSEVRKWIQFFAVTKGLAVTVAPLSLIIEP